MTDRTDVTSGRQIVARWCSLAERRLDYLTELFETGRWRRYYGETAFLENIREAKAAVESWHHLLNCEASRDNSAIDMSWLGRGRSKSPRGEARGEELAATNAPASPDVMPLPALDLATMQQRYPLLRHAI